MAIGPIVTRGFGSFGSISLIVTRGYGIGAAVVSNTPWCLDAASTYTSGKDKAEAYVSGEQIKQTYQSGPDAGQAGC